MLQFKLWLKYWLFRLVDATVSPQGRGESKSVLIVRLDAIGDYVLFRNFLRTIKASEEFKGKRIVLLGNSAWRGLSEQLDNDFVSRFIWVNPRRFARDISYRIRSLKQLDREFRMVINPVYSRDVLVHDMIVHKLQAREKIGQVANASNRFRWHSQFSDNAYSRLIDTGEEVQFEFIRNKRFFSHLVGQPIDLLKPSLNLPVSVAVRGLSRQFAVLFIGAKQLHRRWSPIKFAELASAIQKKYGLDVVICGGPDDLGIAEQFRDHASMNCIDLVGKTTLLELSWVLQKATIVVSNETAAAHLAVAVGASAVFVVSNGNHFGRFTPYPSGMNVPYFPVYHPGLPALLASRNTRQEVVSLLPTREIEVSAVEASIEKNWKEGNN